MQQSCHLNRRTFTALLAAQVSRNYGTLKEKKVRWCGRCAKAHKGVVLPVRKVKPQVNVQQLFCPRLSLRFNGADCVVVLWLFVR